MKRGYASTRLGQVHYATAGESDKPCTVLLPQGGRSWHMFVGLAQRLRDRYRLVAFDYPGSSSSDPIPEGTTFETIAAALIDAMDDLGITTANLYGLHTGNKLGVAMAAKWPDRFHKFVLAGQSHSLVADNDARSRTVGRTRRKFLDAVDDREVALLLWADAFSVVSSVWWRDSLMKTLADRAVRNEAIARAADELQAADCLIDLYRANFAYDLNRDLRRLTVPTLILEVATAYEDRLIGRQGQNLLKIIPDSTLVTMDEPDGHGLTLENRADDLSRILHDFFRR